VLVTELLQQLINTLTVASAYTLVAVGLTVVFGLSQIVNFAYGDFLTVGGYIVFAVAASGGIAFVYGFGLALVAVAVVCLLLERILFRWTLPRPINGFLVSLGLVQVIESILTWKYTDNPVTAKPASSAVWKFGGVYVSAAQTIVFFGTVVLLVAVVLYFDHTRHGTAIRAAAADNEAAALMGAPVSRLISGTFALGGLLAGAGGAFIALLQPLTPTTGALLVVKGFAIALVGGLGNVKGAFVGAAFLAVIETTFVTIGMSSWLEPIEFGLIILVLLVRPEGLLRGMAHTL
jgi:branched-chain amino acid transport system permease protein